MRGATLRLTIFTAFTVFVTVWLAGIIGNLQLFSDTYALKAVFSDATGILNGDLVKIAGVNVGKVTGFEVDDGEAVIAMEISGDVKVPENVIADIKYRNLLGQRVINLTRPEEPASKMLQDGDVIPITNTRPALDLSVVFNNLRPLIHSTNPEEINTVARAVLKVFKGRESDLAGILDNVAALSETLSARDQRLARLVTDLGDVTRVLNGQSSSIRTGVGRFTEFMEALAKLTPTVERVVDRLNAASTKFGRVLSRNKANLNQELSDLAIILDIVDQNLGPLDRVAKNLKEVLLATARSQSYGRWWNLYVVNFCPETDLGGCTGPLGDRR